VTTDTWITTNEAIEILRVSRSKTFQLLKAGEFRTAKLGRNRRIALGSVHAYIARCEDVP
jgi:excisionase family DNA binding protein